MTQIVIGTTPTITYKFKIVSPSDFRAYILKIVFKTLYGIVFAVLWMAKGYITAFLKGL